MHPDLERIVAEDEIGRAGVDAATARCRERIDGAKAAIAAERQARHDALAQQLDGALRAIDDETDREVIARQSRRESYAHERAVAAEAAVDDAVDVFIAIIRSGHGPEGQP